MNRPATLSESTRLSVFAQVVVKALVPKKPKALHLKEVPAFNKDLRLTLLRAQLLQ